MIQRVQTIYLSIAIILLSIVTIGSDLFSYLSETSRFTFNTFGITEYSITTGKIVDTTAFPFYLGTAALVLLSFVCLMSYKNVKRQYKLGRMVFGLYFLMLVSIIILTMFGGSLIDDETSSRELGVGFIIFVVGFPFSFLANTGIKRDKKLLESLDRLR